MNGQQAGALAALRRAKWLVQKYAARLGEFATSPARKRLDELIHDFESNGSSQHGSVKQSLAATVSRAEKRNKLRLEQMEPISAIARAKLAGIPAPKMAKFDVPIARASDVTLLAAGRAMLVAAREYEQVFKAEKLPENFLEQLEAAVEELQETIVARDGDRLERRKATLGILGQVHLARQLLAMFTGFFAKVFSGEPHVIGEWKTAIRIGKKVGGRRRNGDDPPDSPARPGGASAATTGGPTPAATPA